MSKWSTKIYYGDYTPRQQAANADRAICYYEQHQNSGGGHYTMVEVASNASAKSKAWGEDLANRFASVAALKNNGCHQIPKGERGDGNLVHTSMPACLGEPGFIDDKTYDDWIKKPENQKAIAKAVADSIVTAFPNGGLVALSIGHKGKTSNPHDQGASGYDPKIPEVVFNEAIINYVIEYLNAV